MNQNLNLAGIQLLNALSNHAELIMEAYFSGSITETNYSPKVINNLIENRVLWRPDADIHLRLRPSLRKLLEESLRDEHNRELDANIGSALSSLTTLAEHYKEALTQQRLYEAESYLADLTEKVYGIKESLATNVRLLWGRINNEFGYVASVDSKIRENELAQKQVSELLAQLEMFSFERLSDAAGTQRELRQLLVVNLQASFANCAQELSLVQGRLLELLGRFREFRGRTKLLKGFLLHMERKPDFTPVNYASLSKVPKLFNQAQSIISKPHADIHNTDHETELLNIVAKIKANKQLKAFYKAERLANNIKIEQVDSVEVSENQVKQEVEQYFCEVIDTGRSLSALDYHKEKALEFDAEVWIYQVIGGFQGLSDSDREYFDIETHGDFHTIYSGNFIIKDVQLGLR